MRATRPPALENLLRIRKEVPLPPGWKWVNVIGEPAVEGPGHTYQDEHSWLTWYKDRDEWVVRVVPVNYKNTRYGASSSIDTGLADVVEAAKVLAGYVWLGMASP